MSNITKTNNGISPVVNQRMNQRMKTYLRSMIV